jgi:hypothetical protein
VSRDPLKPSTLSVGEQARRIDNRCGDRVAQFSMKQSARSTC